MRTTLDLPDDLLKRAKIVAVERGATLREFVANALRRELDEPPSPRRRRLIKPPIRLAADSPLRSMSAEQIKEIESEDEADAACSVLTRRRLWRG
ncbi:MAG: hypothetical protein H0V62_01625 [Gammaproteobacteria bacterium]|nr:hypothetical protein [Gammaproteobacteria bacterium]